MQEPGSRASYFLTRAGTLVSPATNSNRSALLPGSRSLAARSPLTKDDTASKYRRVAPLKFTLLQFITMQEPGVIISPLEEIIGWYFRWINLPSIQPQHISTWIVMLSK